MAQNLLILVADIITSERIQMKGSLISSAKKYYGNSTVTERFGIGSLLEIIH
jgi:hypothetical protein